jgi:hypothetical protein
MVKLKISKETGIEDTQTIVSDIVDLSQQFINPIDRLRSLSKPAPQGAYTRVPAVNQSLQEFVTKNNFSSIEINSDRPLESRAHCFYRMLGLPVMAPDGSFYNPGFEPNSSRTIDKREKINSNLVADQALQTIMRLRESDVQVRRAIFAKQNLDSTAYALALRYVRSFSNFINVDKGPLEPDSQIYTIQDRIIELANFNGKSNSFEQQRHILRPFIVDPNIADTVTPTENLICVPFLPDKDSTKVDIGKNLLRPAIEFICRLRLQASENNLAFLSEIKRLVNNEQSEDTETAADVRNSILAITGADNLTVLKNNSAFDDIVSKLSSIQFSTITMLVKTIKAVLFQLDHSIREIDTIKPQINFEPIPSTEGPEFGGSIRTVGGGLSTSLFDQKIGLLKILDLNAQQQQKIINQRLGGGNELFAIPVVSNTQKDYSGEIANLTRKRDELGSQAISHLANIERITGEVSGLGLIDILAIYTAFWSIDIDTLIGFLDDDAFQRLYKYNPELRTPEVESRNNGNKINGLEVLEKFETKVFNILSFADKIFDQIRSSPLEVQGGDIR